MRCENDVASIRQVQTLAMCQQQPNDTILAGKRIATVTQQTSTHRRTAGVIGARLSTPVVRRLAGEPISQ